MGCLLHSTFCKAPRGGDCPLSQEGAGSITLALVVWAEHGCDCLPFPCLSCTQLDKLRTIIESMLASSSTLLSMSMAPHKPLTTIAPGQVDPQATCPACSMDLGHQVSRLVQRYEQLQDLVNNLAASRPSKKAKLQSQVSLCLPPSQCRGQPVPWRPCRGVS